MSEILGHDVNGRPLRAGDRVEVAGPAQWGHGQCGVAVGEEPNQRRFPGELELHMDGHALPDRCAMPGHLRRIDDRTDHQPSDFTFDSLMDHLKSGVPA